MVVRRWVMMLNPVLMHIPVPVLLRENDFVKGVEEYRFQSCFPVVDIGFSVDSWSGRIWGCALRTMCE